MWTIYGYPFWEVIRHEFLHCLYSFKYVVKRGGRVISRGGTYDLNRRACEMKARFPDATIKQVGKKVTWQEAEKWIGG